MLGELVPLGGGDPIPLLKKTLLVGRRESCDIVLRFSNVSAHHCQLTCNGGYWYVKDLKSRNGIKVNGNRVVAEKRLDPGDELAIAKHRYDVRYSPYDLGAVGPPPDDQTADVMKQSLLERAGLEVRGKKADLVAKEPKRAPGVGRYDILDDSEGQIKDPNRPV
jgi:pSer/pThr/pTyr-binding forkhead associated (FHA) protein